MSKKPRLLVTAGLPYANGSLHLGHLVEYCQADMYVRAKKRMGEDAIYICADDTHGTPIEVNARKLKITPEELVQRFHEEHARDFVRFDVAFDHYSLTNTDTNRAIVERVYKQLRQAGQLEDREIDGNFCEKDQRFLPDRFIKGTCPKCGAKDQYGDVCEVCGTTYSPTELKEPKCVLCGTTPVVKKSEHVFFKLSADSSASFLRDWIDSGALQPDIANFVRNWIEGGLRDWCITRDGPYFGFTVPDRPNKFFYVWLDAPFGYVSSSVEWGEKHGVSFEELWQSPDKTRIEHFIGKDIVYFHTLFWPAVLKSIGYSLPSNVHVHGMLTVDGEKMSKSRGTFIKASTFADKIEPQALRYYYATKYSAETNDLDLSFEDFVLKVNGELVNKHANLFSRTSQFLAQKLDNRLGDLPFAQADVLREPDAAFADIPSIELAQKTGAELPKALLTLAQRVVVQCKRVEEAYAKREFGEATRLLNVVSDIANGVMQEQKPWDQLKTDPESARVTCTFAANVCHALAMYLWPIVPRFSEAGARVFGTDISQMSTKKLFGERKRNIGALERLFERVDKKQIEAIVEASKDSNAAQQATSSTPAIVPVAPLKDVITYDDFAKVDLRVGLIRAAEAVPKSKKLLKLSVDLGEAAPRQIVAGIGNVYKPEELVGTRVVVVANLAPAKLMGIESQGMILAGGEAPELSVLRVERELSPGSSVK